VNNYMKSRKKTEYTPKSKRKSEMKPLKIIMMPPLPMKRKKAKKTSV